MSSVIPPWPPDNYQEAQPYDQRASCWPWGPCHPSEKLPMRFDCIGTKTGGPVGDLWHGMKTGVLAVAEPSTCNNRKWFGVLNLNVPPAQPSILTILPTDDPAIWYADLLYCTYTVEPLFAILTAAGGLTESSCGSDFILPVNFAFGAFDAPQFVTCTAVPWYQDSEYAWNE